MKAQGDIEESPAEGGAAQDGQLNFKQYGLKLLVSAAILGGIDWMSSHGILTSEPGVAEHWSVMGGIPIVVFAVVFGVAGITFVALGVFKKS